MGLERELSTFSVAEEHAKGPDPRGLHAEAAEAEIRQLGTVLAEHHVLRLEVSEKRLHAQMHVLLS